jgi:hypothetical protein
MLMRWCCSQLSSSLSQSRHPSIVPFQRNLLPTRFVVYKLILTMNIAEVYWIYLCFCEWIRVITKLSNSKQSYKGKIKAHNYINKGNNKITELRTILQRESQNSQYFDFERTNVPNEVYSRSASCTLHLIY